jgi:XRE family transcriptional regulator, regulator of sulfur utilization
VTLNVAVLPAASEGVFLPAILKSWLIVPLFVTLNVVRPLATVRFESVNLNSLGLPAVTATVVAVCWAEPPKAETAATSAASAATTTSNDLIRNVRKRTPSCQRIRLLRSTRIDEQMSNMLDTVGARVTMGSVDMTSSHDPALGAALRQARNARGLSLTQVAEATSISRSLLSLIETGRSDITIGRLGRLARLYDLRLADLVPEPRHPDPLVVRADDRPLMHYDSEEIDVEVLVPEGPHALQALLATYAPRARMEDFVVQQNEQFIYLLEGHVRTEFADGREIELGPGDSATFISGEGGHRHVNLVDTVSRMVIVIRRTHAR